MASNYKAIKADGIYELSYAKENKREDGNNKSLKCLVCVGSQHMLQRKIGLMFKFLNASEEFVVRRAKRYRAVRLSCVKDYRLR
ncbi:MAG: hypothetical protein M3458_17095 [Acidobacteriota bacterium]|nr:hypothetical protein [Acidobacteriota bacterium]